MSAPFEVIATPFVAYIAPLATAFPAVNAVVAAPWVLVGKNGSASYSGDGVKVTHNQTIVQIRPDGVTAPIKALRTEEDLLIEMTIWDLTMESYSLVLNSNGITSVDAASGVPGTKAVSLNRGPDVKQMALLVRGTSPYMDGGALQYEVPIVVHSGNPSPVFKKGVPASLVLTFMAMADINTPASYFGVVKAMTAAALP